MPVSLTLLRRLAEQQNPLALREACESADDGEPGVQTLLALACARLGSADEARRLLAPLEPDTLDVATRVDLAAVHIALGDLDRAIDLLERARQAAGQDADQALLLARLAWCRLQQGRRDEALALYQRSVVLEPRPGVFRVLLELYRDTGRLTEMAECLDAAFAFLAHRQADRSDHFGRQLRGLQLDLWLAQDRLEAAEAWLERQRDTLGEDDWCGLLSTLARRLAARDRHAQAEEWLRIGLRRHPQQLPLYVQLAELAQLQGRAPQAMALLRRAIHLANAANRPTDWLWTRLSAAALEVSPRLAREAAEHARAGLDEAADETLRGSDSLADRRLQADLALAAVDVRERNHAAAERRYRQILEQQPQLIAALQGLGQLYMQLGRIDEAVTLFERVKAMDPARGHGALISARRFPEDDATLERLERLARTPGLEGSLRTGLLFQLAAAWEKRADYDRAFALAADANAAIRRLLRYDPQAHRQRCARIRHAFPRALFEHRRDVGHPSTVPVFVVGMPRSGTTLVEQILAGHRRIHGAGELGTMPRVIAGLERWERHTGSGRRYPDCVDDLDATVTLGIAENVLTELREYAPDADHVVDKLPHNFENVGLIKLLFPRAKIVSVRRDPRDIAVSNFFTDYAARHGGMGFAYDLDWIGEQLADHNLLMHHWQQLFGDDILEIRYEDVVDDPETSARRLLDHIGVAWDPQVLDFAALERPVNTASVWQVRQPLYASSKARWRHYQQHLGALITATNRKITWEAIDMVTLPEPGWLNAGVDCYRQGDLDAAEYRFRKLLHHVPEHAAGSFMLGLIYVHKGHLGDGIDLMERALERCPWNGRWRSDLVRACRLDGRDERAAALAAAAGSRAAGGPEPSMAEAPATHLDYLFLSGESTCASSRPTLSVTHG